MRLALWLISRAQLSFVQPKSRTRKLIYFRLFSILKLSWAIPIDLRKRSEKFQIWFKLMDFLLRWRHLITFQNFTFDLICCKIKIETLKNKTDSVHWGHSKLFSYLQLFFTNADTASSPLLRESHSLASP